MFLDLGLKMANMGAAKYKRSLNIGMYMNPIMCYILTMKRAIDPKLKVVSWNDERTPLKNLVLIATNGTSCISGSCSTSLVTK